MCTFQPGKCTGWGSEWVNNNNKKKKKKKKENNKEFIERFQRLKLLYNFIKEKKATRKYRHTNQWYINKQTNSISPFTAPACKISGLKAARTRPRTAYFPVLWHMSHTDCQFESAHVAL